MTLASTDQCFGNNLTANKSEDFSDLLLLTETEDFLTHNSVLSREGFTRHNCIKEEITPELQQNSRTQSVSRTTSSPITINGEIRSRYIQESLQIPSRVKSPGLSSYEMRSNTIIEDINNNTTYISSQLSKSNLKHNKALPTISALTSPFKADEFQVSNNTQENLFRQTCSSPNAISSLAHLQSTNSSNSSTSPRSVDLLVSSSGGVRSSVSPCIVNLAAMNSETSLLHHSSRIPDHIQQQYFIDGGGQLILPGSLSNQSNYVQQPLLSASNPYLNSSQSNNPHGVFASIPNQTFPSAGPPAHSPYFASNFVDPTGMIGPSPVMIQLNSNQSEFFNAGHPQFLAQTITPDSTATSPTVEKTSRGKGVRRTPNLSKKSPKPKMKQENEPKTPNTPKRNTLLPTDLRLKAAKTPRHDDSTEENSATEDSLSDMDRLRIEKKRARNRVAARKCRERKLSLINSLEAEVSEWQHRNERLKSIINQYETVCKESASKLRSLCDARPDLYAQLANLPIMSKNELPAPHSPSN